MNDLQKSTTTQDVGYQKMTWNILSQTSFCKAARKTFSRFWDNLNPCDVVFQRVKASA